MDGRRRKGNEKGGEEGKGIKTNSGNCFDCSVSRGVCMLAPGSRFDH